MNDVAVRLLHPLASLPVRQLLGDAGADLSLVEAMVLEPGQRGLGRTGIALELPTEAMGLVMPRSGLALRSGVTVLNAPGLIDSGYRGEIQVLLINLGDERVELAIGDRVAQLVIAGFHAVDFVSRDELAPSERGTGGFGHTGIDRDRRQY